MKNTIGTVGEENSYKLYYFIFIIGIFVFLAWSAIGVGVHPEKARVVNYYMWMGLIALAFILFDNLTKKHFHFIDTITIEQTPIKPKWILLIGLVIGVVMAQRIYATNTAFVPYPTFQLFDHRLPNALLSGVAGLVEDLFFFAFLLPTTYAILQLKVFKNSIISGVVSVFLISLLFMVFHIFAYGLAHQVALMMSFFFAIISASLTLLLRTVIISNILHFTNNTIASFIIARVAFLFW